MQVQGAIDLFLKDPVTLLTSKPTCTCTCIRFCSNESDICMFVFHAAIILSQIIWDRYAARFEFLYSRSLKCSLHNDDSYTLRIILSATEL